jgi:Methyladenine glycosylase
MRHSCRVGFAHRPRRGGGRRRWAKPTLQSLARRRAKYNNEFPGWAHSFRQAVQNNRRSLSEVPARTEHSDAFSNDLKRRGFTFVGSTISQGRSFSDFLISSTSRSISVVANRRTWCSLRIRSTPDRLSECLGPNCPRTTSIRDRLDQPLASIPVEEDIDLGGHVVGQLEKLLPGRHRHEHDRGTLFDRQLDCINRVV